MKACPLVLRHGSLPGWWPVFLRSVCAKRTINAGVSRAVFVAFVAAVTCVAATAACQEPTRLPLVIPTTPSETLYALAGTVTETEPTTSTRIPNTFVSLDGINSGQSAMSDAEGRFLFRELKGGQFNLVASRDGYLTNSFVIYLTRDSDFAIRLDPVPDITTTTFQGTLASAGLDCWGEPSPQPCRSHSFTTHRRGIATARLTWTGSAELSMLMTNGWDTWARGTREFSVSLDAGQHDVWVVYSSGTAAGHYTLTITHHK